MRLVDKTAPRMSRRERDVVESYLARVMPKPQGGL
jgi:hypothetical protein